MTDYKQILRDVENARLSIAKASGGGSARAAEEARMILKNTLFNNASGIIDALKFAVKGDSANENIREELEAAESALAQMDEENTKLRKKIAELEQPKEKKKSAG